MEKMVKFNFPDIGKHNKEKAERGYEDNYFICSFFHNLSTKRDGVSAGYLDLHRSQIKQDPLSSDDIYRHV